LDEAIKIKEQFALGHKKNASSNDFYELNNSSRTKINQLEASDIVMSRFEQILNSIKSEIEHLTSKKLDYIIFTGGSSNMTHLNYLIEDEFGSNASIGKIKIVGVRNNKYSSVVGNILFFVDKLRLKGESYSMFSKNEIKELQNTSADVADEKIDTKLSKVFGYFFGE
jgi:cell division ATPase FtsA